MLHPTTTRHRATRRHTASVAVGAALASLSWMAGCTGELNTSDALRGTDPLPALLVEPVGIGIPDDGPSLRSVGENGWDRRHWEPVVVSVPRGQVQTNPSGFWTASTRPMVEPSLPRRRGAFPVEVEALDVAGDPGAAAAEAALTVVAAPGGLLIGLPLDLIVHGRWPWSAIDEPAVERRGGAGRYDRLPPDAPRSPWPWIGADQP